MRRRDAASSSAAAVLPQELTDLEQFVLIQIFDQSWKDHLYAMDMLRSGIGLQAFAEQDPRMLYKKEGYSYFEQMMAGVRDKVTDLIFRARVVGQPQARSNYRETAAVHETSHELRRGGKPAKRRRHCRRRDGGEMQQAAQTSRRAKARTVKHDRPRSRRRSAATIRARAAAARSTRSAAARTPRDRRLTAV